MSDFTNLQFFVPIEEITTRRQKVVDSMLDDAIFILTSSEIKKKNADVDFPFRQDSNFWYLTGLNQEDSILVIKKTDGKIKEFIFTPKKDKTREIWIGIKLGLEEVSQKSGITVENIFWFEDFENHLPQFLQGIENVYFDLVGDYQDLRQKISSLIASQNRRNWDENILCVRKVHELIVPLRIIKSDWEIEQMKIASQINTKAHLFGYQNMLKKHKLGQRYFEFEFEADLYYFYKKNGLNWSYPAIVASGQNACVLHYTENDKLVNSQDLVLVDAGCEVNYYASDITRMYPISGKFSEAQKEIYEIVLDANKQIIQFLANHKTNFGTEFGTEFGTDYEANYASYHDKTVEILTTGLINLGIIKTPLETAIKNKEYFKYFMHGVGHWLGLDVHDLGYYLDKNGRRMSTKFTKGMCVTVEPGLYFDPNDETTPLKYRGIGVRIEDDIVITEDGILNLTESLPKEILEIERIALEIEL
jgi:Xaa-Pro aminopeptidase